MSDRFREDYDDAVALLDDLPVADSRRVLGRNLLNDALSLRRQAERKLEEARREILSPDEGASAMPRVRWSR